MKSERRRTRTLFAAITASLLLSAAAPAVLARPAPETFAPLVEKLAPAVVNISTTTQVEVGNSAVQLPEGVPEDSPLGQLFRRFQPRQNQDGEPVTREARSLGSGFIIDATGYIVTNNHVITGRGNDPVDKVTVTLSDERQFDAKIIGRDPATDLALLKIEAKDLPFVSWGDSQGLRQGDWLLAIGNPFGFGGSVTAGIVSAVHRDLNAGNYDRFIQTDASINRGNSGGPVFDGSGGVVGIATAIVSPTGGNVGIGFAIPTEQARPIIDQLRTNGRVRRGWLGVRIQAVTDDIAQALGFDKTKGAIVAATEPETPAAKAGVQSGDVILAFDGKAIERGRSLPSIVSDTAIGKTADLDILRNGKPLKLRVTVGEFPADAQLASTEAPKPEAPKAAQPETTDNKSLGLTLQPLTTALREQLKIEKSVQGVVVAKVDPNSDAASRGLRTGDVILQINQRVITTPQVAAEVIDGVKKDGRSVVVILLQREDDRLNVPVKLKADK